MPMVRRPPARLLSALLLLAPAVVAGEPSERRSLALAGTVDLGVVSTAALSAELRLGDSLGLAVALGWATLFGYEDGPAARLQVRYYPVGSFDGGLQLGAELDGSALRNGRNAAAFGHAPQADPGWERIYAYAGSFAGYKHVTAGGLAVEPQVGLKVALLKPARNGRATAVDAVAGQPFDLIARLGVGYCF